MDIWDAVKALFWIMVVSGTVYCFTSSVKRLFQVTSGLVVLGTINTLYDFGLWPIIQGLYGGWGIVALICGVFVMNFTLLLFYRRSQIDWLGITVVDDVILKGKNFRQAYQSSFGLKRLGLALPTFTFWIVEKAITVRLIPFLALSIFQDSFVATAFYLHRKNGGNNTELKGEDYAVFVLSTVFSCLVWALGNVWIIIPSFQNLWRTIT